MIETILGILVAIVVSFLLGKSKGKKSERVANNNKAIEDRVNSMRKVKEIKSNVKNLNDSDIKLEFDRLYNKDRNK